MVCQNGSERRPDAPESGWISYQADLANNFQRLFAAYAWAASEYIADIDAFCSGAPPVAEEITALDILNPVSLFNKLKSQAKAKKWYEWCQCKRLPRSCRGNISGLFIGGGGCSTRVPVDTWEVELSGIPPFSVAETPLGACNGNGADGARFPLRIIDFGGATAYEFPVQYLNASIEWSCTGGPENPPPPPDPPNPPPPPDWPPDLPPPPPPPPGDDMGCSCNEIRQIIRDELSDSQDANLEPVKALIREKSSALSEEVALASSAAIIATGGATGIRLSPAKASIVLGLLKDAFEAGQAGVDLINSIVNLFDNINDNGDNSAIIKEIRKARDLILLNGCGISMRVRVSVTQIPENIKAYSQSNGTDRFYNLGWFEWLSEEGDVVGEKMYIEFRDNLFTASDPNIATYQYHFHEGVQGTVELVPIPENPFGDVAYPIINW